MNIEASTDAILNLILGQGKEFERMDPVLQRRFLVAFDLLIRAHEISDIGSSKALNLKEFDGHYQINVDGEKRIWIEDHNGELLVTFFGSTDHKHGKKR